MNRFAYAGIFLLFANSLLAEDGVKVSLRQRVPDPAGASQVVSEKREEVWEPAKTAIIVCDMWDKHWCPTATARVAEMAPVMNNVLKEARGRGVFIVHAPSETMAFYAKTPQRQRAQNAPKAANFPTRMADWCSLDPKKEGKLPIDDSDGGCDCENPPKEHRAWRRQIETIEIAGNDAISDSGREIWNLLEERGIQNVIIMGVHTNMCVLGRPFGIRNLVLAGKKVVLMRDMTDTMYNPAKPPQVSHFEGTELVVAHIERHWCPTVTSATFTGEAPFRFSGDTSDQ